MQARPRGALRRHRHDARLRAGAAKHGVAVAHLESGLRSLDWTTPEEINRVVIDRLADTLLAPRPRRRRQPPGRGRAHRAACTRSARPPSTRSTARAHARCAPPGAAHSLAPRGYVLVRCTARRPPATPAAWRPRPRRSRACRDATRWSPPPPRTRASWPAPAGSTMRSARLAHALHPRPLGPRRVPLAPARGGRDRHRLRRRPGGGVGARRPLSLTRALTERPHAPHGTNVLLGDDPAAIAGVRPTTTSAYLRGAAVGRARRRAHRRRARGHYALRAPWTVNGWDVASAPGAPLRAAGQRLGRAGPGQCRRRPRRSRCAGAARSARRGAARARCSRERRDVARRVDQRVVAVRGRRAGAVRDRQHAARGAGLVGHQGAALLDRGQDQDVGGAHARGTSSTKPSSCTLGSPSSPASTGGRSGRSAPGDDEAAAGRPAARSQPGLAARGAGPCAARHARRTARSAAGCPGGHRAAAAANRAGS